MLFVGVEVKGSQRWLSFAGVSIQPSEFMKPAFVVICAWLFAEHARQPEIPGNLFAMILLGIVLALLVAQPDLGQTMLVLGTWGAMFFMAGMPWLWIVVIGGVGAFGAFGAYTVFPHVAGRIDRFLTGEGDTFQVDMGREAIIRGGWFGAGAGRGHGQAHPARQPYRLHLLGGGRGIRHHLLPGDHAALFAFIVLRGLQVALQGAGRFHPPCGRRPGRRCSASSRSSTWASICSCMPAKGMTLPFISYGGSSLIAMAISMGMVLALTRKRPEKRSDSASAPMPRHAVPAE